MVVVVEILSLFILDYCVGESALWLLRPVVIKLPVLDLYKCV